MSLDRFPTIKKAALILAYDNGCINRNRSEESFLASAEEVIFADGISEEDLTVEEAWLAGLSEDDLEIICAGEVSEADAIFEKAPAEPRIGPDLLTVGESVKGLLLDIFEQG